jgi:diaminohydroxyphosphoribosylaminopyrimidine deaminase/5-amino-6-(5-phosphoribosylamino)uracil reductase
MGVSPFMQIALKAAEGVRGSTSSNPWVGAVIVRDGAVVATGATAPPGGLHAEADALARAGAAARGADVYVTLEPCTAFPGKRTPPCADALVAAGVRRVVVALEDPHGPVDGAGLDLLRSAGLEVEVGDGRAEAVALLRPYLKHRATGLPYVIAKFAASLDGRVATSTGESQWITGPEARDLSHRQRAWVDAVLAGSGTVLADDPSLTARPGGAPASRQPLRVVVDARGRVPPAAKLFAEAGPVLIATTQRSDRAWRAAIAGTGAQLLDCEPADAGLNLHQLLRTLGSLGVLSVWTEGGPTLLGSLFDEGLVDEVWAFVAPLIIGGAGRPAVAGAGAAGLAAAWRLREAVVERAGPDMLVRGYVGEFSP